MPSPSSPPAKPAPVSIRPAAFSVPPAAEVTEDDGAASTAVPEERTPLWAGRIRAGDEVGRGAMGSVLRGMDTRLRRELAIKVTSLSRAELPTTLLGRFVEEA